MDLSVININFWILQSIAMGLTALCIPRLQITSLFGATIMVVGLALVNAHLWDAALFISLPDSLTLHTLTLLAANGLIFWILVKILPGIEVNGVLPALVAPAVFSIISIALSTYGSQIDFLGISEKGVERIEEMRAQLKQTRDAARDKAEKTIEKE